MFTDQGGETPGIQVRTLGDHHLLVQPQMVHTLGTRLTEISLNRAFYCLISFYYDYFYKTFDSLCTSITMERQLMQRRSIWWFLDNREVLRRQIECEPLNKGKLVIFSSHQLFSFI